MPSPYILRPLSLLPPSALFIHPSNAKQQPHQPGPATLLDSFIFSFTFLYLPPPPHLQRAARATPPPVAPPAIGFVVIVNYGRSRRKITANEKTKAEAREIGKAMATLSEIFWCCPLQI